MENRQTTIGTMIRIFFVGLMGLAAVTMATGEVVEEEAWYNADGKVVKTVKRTLTGADARKGTVPVAPAINLKMRSMPMIWVLAN